MHHPDSRSAAMAAVAIAAAAFLVAGCQPAPKVSAFSDTPAQQAEAERLQQAGAMEPLQPFDEHFYVAPPQAQPASAP